MALPCPIQLHPLKLFLALAKAGMLTTMLLSPAVPAGWLRVKPLLAQATPLGRDMGSPGGRQGQAPHLRETGMQLTAEMNAHPPVSLTPQEARQKRCHSCLSHGPRSAPSAVPWLSVHIPTFHVSIGNFASRHYQSRSRC